MRMCVLINHTYMISIYLSFVCLLISVLDIKWGELMIMSNLKLQVDS